MRALPDRWNPRLWIRDWLAKPSREEASSGEPLPNRTLIDATMFGSVNTTAQGEPKAVEYGQEVGGHFPTPVLDAFLNRPASATSPAAAFAPRSESEGNERSEQS
ncbi:MAG: hypothetical protein GAK31_01698 [Stenotrophomonas maltophilia]|uniref:Uncharacterized protein n=1 Tax=Stenotrophomonas maltophilia TaxID=40324 RepID=A0A7V8FI74_STEMA|nr:MAG: hypothetical protein GAK31_01698 [Stenotrophomonas maltophilia]